MDGRRSGQDRSFGWETHGRDREGSKPRSGSRSRSKGFDASERLSSGKKLTRKEFFESTKKIFTELQNKEGKLGDLKMKTNRGMQHLDRYDKHQIDLLHMKMGLIENIIDGESRIK
jgi:hypothetical protein